MYFGYSLATANFTFFPHEKPQWRIVGKFESGSLKCDLPLDAGSSNDTFRLVFLLLNERNEAPCKVRLHKLPLCSPPSMSRRMHWFPTAPTGKTLCTYLTMYTPTRRWTMKTTGTGVFKVQTTARYLR